MPARAERPPQAEPTARSRPRSVAEQTKPAEKRVTIHVPADDLARGERRGSRKLPARHGRAAKNGRGRGSEEGRPAAARAAARAGRKRAASREDATTNGAESTDEPPRRAARPPSQPSRPASPPRSRSSGSEDAWGYVPMSEWGDELEG